MLKLAYAMESEGYVGKMKVDKALASGVPADQLVRSVWWDLCSLNPCSEG